MLFFHFWDKLDIDGSIEVGTLRASIGQRGVGTKALYYLEKRPLHILLSPVDVNLSLADVQQAQLLQASICTWWRIVDDRLPIT